MNTTLVRRVSASSTFYSYKLHLKKLNIKFRTKVK